MKETESIPDTVIRFIEIVNKTCGLGKVFNKEELTCKVLYSLMSRWNSKVTAIEEFYNLSKIA